MIELHFWSFILGVIVGMVGSLLFAMLKLCGIIK